MELCNEPFHRNVHSEYLVHVLLLDPLILSYPCYSRSVARICTCFRIWVHHSNYIMFQSPITCSSLQIPTSGSVECTRSPSSRTREYCGAGQCPYNTHCTYRCNSGYQLIGATSTRCQGSTHPGSWSSSKPSCRGRLSLVWVNKLLATFWYIAKQISIEV